MVFPVHYSNKTIYSVVSLQSFSHSFASTLSSSLLNRYLICIVDHWDTLIISPAVSLRFIQFFLLFLTAISIPTSQYCVTKVKEMFKKQNMLHFCFIQDVRAVGLVVKFQKFSIFNILKG